jgi:hypothetical protein
MNKEMIKKLITYKLGINCPDFYLSDDKTKYIFKEPMKVTGFLLKSILVDSVNKIKEEFINNNKNIRKEFVDGKKIVLILPDDITKQARFVKYFNRIKKEFKLNNFCMFMERDYFTDKLFNTCLKIDDISFLDYFWDENRIERIKNEDFYFYVEDLETLRCVKKYGFKTIINSAKIFCDETSDYVINNKDKTILLCCTKTEVDFFSKKGYKVFKIDKDYFNKKTLFLDEAIKDNDFVKETFKIIGLEYKIFNKNSYKNIFFLANPSEEDKSVVITKNKDLFDNELFYDKYNKVILEDEEDRIKLIRQIIDSYGDPFNNINNESQEDTEELKKFEKYFNN